MSLFGFPEGLAGGSKETSYGTSHDTTENTVYDTTYNTSQPTSHTTSYNTSWSTLLGNTSKPYSYTEQTAGSSEWLGPTGQFGQSQPRQTSLYYDTVRFTWNSNGITLTTYGSMSGMQLGHIYIPKSMCFNSLFNDVDGQKVKAELTKTSSINLGEVIAGVVYNKVYQKRSDGYDYNGPYNYLGWGNSNARVRFVGGVKWLSKGDYPAQFGFHGQYKYQDSRGRDMYTVVRSSTFPRTFHSSNRAEVNFTETFTEIEWKVYNAVHLWGPTSGDPLFQTQDKTINYTGQTHRTTSQGTSKTTNYNSSFPTAHQTDRDTTWATNYDTNHITYG